MKMRTLIAFALVALVAAFACAVSAPAAPNTASAHAVPAATPQPNAAPTAPAAEPHPEIREAIASLRHAKEHLSMRRTISAGIAWKRSGRRTRPFTSSRNASSTTGNSLQ